MEKMECLTQYEDKAVEDEGKHTWEKIRRQQTHKEVKVLIMTLFLLCQVASFHAQTTAR